MKIIDNKALKSILNKEVELKNCYNEVSSTNPDPILIARVYKDEFVSLICALFAYGNVKAILNLLKGFDFSLLDESESTIRKEVNSYYRFQKKEDIVQFFITLRRIKKEDSIKNIFLKGYNKKEYVMDGVNSLINEFNNINSYKSRGYKFLIGSICEKDVGVGSYKRWNMFLRWMVRCDNIDLGLWNGVKKSSLIMPLDTHTFNVSRHLMLLDRKTCDLKAAKLLTQKLKEFDKDDPVKYDFAIYRMGQKDIYPKFN